MREMLVVAMVLLVGGVVHAQTFESATSLPGGGVSLAVHDLNGDGLPDVLAVSAFYRELRVFLAETPGRFRAAAGYPLGGQPAIEDGALATGDFNRDGRLDVAVALGTSGVAVMLGSATGVFDPATRVVTPAGAEALSVAIADMTSDGKPDLVVGMASGVANLTVFPGNGTGDFGLSSSLLRLSDTACGTEVVAGDFTQDGRTDVLVTCRVGGPYLVFGDGAGGFGAPGSSVSAAPAPQRRQTSTRTACRTSWWPTASAVWC